ncbi:hypothetical protein ACFLT7_00975 [candidate division KSB1 bacterium]
MKKQFLYISIHHQETVNHPTFGNTQRDLQSMTDSLFPCLPSGDRLRDGFPDEMSLEIMQEILENNKNISEKAVLYNGEDCRTMMLAMVLEADGGCAIPDSGIWYGTTDEREGLAYFAQMVMIPYNPHLADAVERFQAGLEQAREVFSPSHT